MPYMADGTPADIVLNPLACSRMNVVRVLRFTWLGRHGLGQRIGDISRVEAKVAEFRGSLDTIYNQAGKKESLGDMSYAEVVEMAENSPLKSRLPPCLTAPGRRSAPCSSWRIP
jgi:DNA-directed RNA polymerase subunit beta